MPEMRSSMRTMASMSSSSSGRMRGAVVVSGTGFLLERDRRTGPTAYQVLRLRTAGRDHARATKARRAGIAPRPSRAASNDASGLVPQHRQLLLAGERRRTQLVEVHTTRHRSTVLVRSVPGQVV